MRLFIVVFMSLYMGLVCAAGTRVNLSISSGGDKVLYDLEQLLIEQNVVEIVPAQVSGGFSTIVTMNKLIAGLDVQLEGLFLGADDEKLEIASMSGQAGYALFNDEQKMVGVLATFGYASIQKEELVGEEQHDVVTGDMILGGKLIAYFSLVGGTVAEIKILPSNNLVQVVSDLDIQLLQLGDIFKKSGSIDLGVLKLNLSPKVRYTSSRYGKELDAALYLSVDVISSVAVSLFAGAGVQHDFSARETTPYITVGFNLGLDLELWERKKEED